MPYLKENNQFIFVDLNGKKLFSSARIGLLMKESKIIEHGPADKMKNKYVQMMQCGQQVSCAETDEWDLDSLNKQTANIAPDF